ncbi:DUF4442 domain-containing protein [Pseudofulvibacter geojedonensis]|uniref:DUF4442 domain-containing protein n=1 Tax=Pseudofulvibacter geojedonensis TaxID=1123758 RepID=A0ABW3I018_9FLAO
MYRRSTARIVYISSNMYKVKIKLPISYKNRNYVGAIFGGSMQAATDPIYMIQLLNILGDDYVVWDKAACIKYKKPAREDLYGSFVFFEEEIKEIVKDVTNNKEIDYKKLVTLTNSEGEVYSEINKTLYIAQKDYYKQKLKSKNRKG